MNRRAVFLGFNNKKQCPNNFDFDAKLVILGQIRFNYSYVSATVVVTLEVAKIISGLSYGLKSKLRTKYFLICEKLAMQCQLKAVYPN